MNPLLAMLAEAGIITPADAVRLTNLLDEDAARAYAERRIAAAFQSGLAQQQGRLVTLLRQYGVGVTDPILNTFWANEAREFYRDVIPVLTGVAEDVALIATVRGGGLDHWQAINEGVINWVEDYYISTGPGALGSIPNLDDTARTIVGNLINQWQRGELEVATTAEGLPALIAAMEDAFGPERGARIAVTEYTRIAAESTRAAAQANPNVTHIRWETGRDEFVCFPAGTMVLTVGGDIPIEQVVPGQMVVTRQGPKRVKATSKREYSGEMVTLVTARGVRLTSTANHPIWSQVEQTWLEAAQFQVGDTVELVDHQPDRVVGVFKFGLGNSDNRPSMPTEVFVFGGVPARWMPISAVHFNGDHLVGNGKVNTVAPNSVFLSKGNVGRRKSLADVGFKQGFTLRPTITSEGTKLPIRVCGLNANTFATGFAFDVSRRAAAFLRAEPLRPSLFVGHDDFTATFTGALNSLVSAFPTANVVSVGNARFDGELFSANAADFRHHFGGVGILIAFEAAIVALSKELNSFKWLATVKAVLRRGVLSLGHAIAGRRAILLARLRWSGFELLATVGARSDFHASPRESDEQPVTTLYHTPSPNAIDVYDIQVEESPEFYANGVLVHNCEICGPLDGVTIRKGGTFPGGLQPPAHVNCRCGLAFESELTMDVPLGVGGAGTWNSQSN